MASRVSVIVPTFNEAKNVYSLIPLVSEVFTKHKIDGEIIVVDDDSPDKTWKVAEELGARFPVKAIRRKGERGLSSAVIKGFSCAKGDIVGVMDADFSHSPEYIVKLVEAIETGGADIALGSRYMEAGRTKEWPWYRKLASRTATFLASPFTQVKDPMSGFIFLRRQVIEGVRLNPIGFKIALEIIARGRYQKLKEVPIVFQNRLYGESKLTRGVIVEYLKQIWQLFWEVETPIGQFIKFCLVGSMGLLVNLAVFSALIYALHVHHLAAAVVSFGVAFTCNFCFNRTWTFKVCGANSRDSIRTQYGRFLTVCLLGLGVNLLVLHFLLSVLGWNEVIAQLFAILTATALNFMASKKWAFK